MNQPVQLVIRAAATDLLALAPLVREGVEVRAASGKPLRRTLVEDFGFDPDCVERRIQTVFLDGSPVDDIDADSVRAGCTLALAGALPGVAGIAMRRGSPVGVFREGVTHHAADPNAARADGLRLTLKLFNSVAEECLAALLSRGVELAPERLAELLEARPAALAGAAFELAGSLLARTGLAEALRSLPQRPLLLLAARP